MPSRLPVAVVLPALLLAALGLSARAADASNIPNPLKNIKEGQWAELRISTPEGDLIRKQTLLSIEGEGGDRVLTFMISLHLDGELVDEGEQQITYDAAMAEQERSLAGAEDMTISNVKAVLPGGAEVDAVLVSFTQDDTRFSLYLTESVPIVGLVKMLVDGIEEPVMELIGFGE